ncbi:MAG: Pr6Pr family membrane protein [Candidatus Heimdallarchaeota archaeon]|nr:Pr6Pr family membrane protein [Candidatus Heimdallarchaeota archaeon]
MSFTDKITGNIYYFRLVFMLIAWTGVILRFVVTGLLDESFIEPLKFFTVQTNLMVAIWLTLAVIYKDGREDVNQEKMDQLYGLIRGGITAFITLTWLAYWFLLSSTFDPVNNLHDISSTLNHYVSPIYFILDWVLTEKKQYKLKDALIWLIYPLVFLIFAFILQKATSDPIYGFLEGDGFFVMGPALYVLFIVFAFTYLGLNKLLVKTE